MGLVKKTLGYVVYTLSLVLSTRDMVGHLLILSHEIELFFVTGELNLFTYFLTISFVSRRQEKIHNKHGVLLYKFWLSHKERSCLD